MTGEKVKNRGGRPRNAIPTTKVRVPMDMYERIQALPGGSFGERLRAALELGIRSPELARELLRPGWRSREARLEFVGELEFGKVDGEGVVGG